MLACLAAELVVLRVGIDDLDEGYFVQQAARVAHGQVPYRDFQTLYSPGLVYLHAALFDALGGPSLVGARALALAARAGLALLLYGLTRPLVRRPGWAAAPALVLLIGLDDAPVRWEPHPGWLSSLFAVLSVWSLSHRPSSRWLLGAGAAAALAYLFKQNTGVFVLAAVLMWCWRSRLSLRLPLAAFAAVTLAWLAPLLIGVGGQLATLGVLVGAVNQTSLASAPDVPNVIALACLAGGAWLMRRDSDPRLRLYVLGGTALFLTQYPRMDTLHLVWSAPLLLVVGAIALDRARPAFAALAVVATVALLAPTGLDRLAYVRQPLAKVADVVAPLPTANDLRGVVDEIQQRTRPGEPIFVYPTSPLLYVLADRPNPTRFDHLNPGAADARQINQVIADLTDAHVRLVVISDFWVSVWGPPGPNATIDDWLAAHFTEIARHGAYRVLAGL